MADWSKLPYDIIEIIAIRLDAVEDFIAFSAVCRSWRSFYLAKQWTPGAQVPWLMLADNGNKHIRRFFSLYREKEYILELPEAHGTRCWGSSDGWLITVGSDFEIHILNAFTRVCVRLPSMDTFQVEFDTARVWDTFIDKAILIKKPSQMPMANDEDFLVIAIYGPLQQLAFSKPGYASWINVQDSFDRRFIDVAYLNDQIFALSDMGTLLAVDIKSQPPKIDLIASPPHECASDQLFLVESSGDLLMVYQSYYVNPYDLFFEQIPSEYHELMPYDLPVEKKQFQVYVFDFAAKEWILLEDLGDLALFVGDNYSMSATTKFAKCRGNCIYFMGRKVDSRAFGHFRDFECGVYNMADRSVRHFFFHIGYPSYYPCPIWLTPTLC